MTKQSRNQVCSCGSGKKYKKCCLYKAIGSPVKIDRNQSRILLVKTLTDELFQPMRLYYTVHDGEQLKVQLGQLKCIDYNSELEDWTVRYEDEAASIDLKVSPSEVPAQAQPLIIATIYMDNNELMLIDVRSIERAARIIEFINKYISRDFAEMTHAAIYNKLITTTQQDAKDLDFDDVFNENRITVIDPEKTLSELKANAAQYEDKQQAMEAALKKSQENAKKPLPEVEKFPTHYYEDGIGHFETMCRLRQAIATQHFLGRKDFTFYDLMQELFNNGKNKNLCLE